MKHFFICYKKFLGCVFLSGSLFSPLLFGIPILGHFLFFMLFYDPCEVL